MARPTWKGFCGFVDKHYVRILEVAKVVGMAVVSILGMCTVPNVLEEAKLRDSVYSTIVKNIEALTAGGNCTRRDLTVAGLGYVLSSKALDGKDGRNMLNNACYTILSDYEYSGDAKGIMKALVDNGINTERHAAMLSRSALTMDFVDVLGGLRLKTENTLNRHESMDTRHENLNQIALHIKAALLHYERIIYVLKNRTPLNHDEAHKRIMDRVVNNVRDYVFGGNVAVIVDDTPFWIQRCEVRVYGTVDMEFAKGLLKTVNDGLLRAGQPEAACAVRDYTMNVQGKLFTERVLEVTIPVPPYSKPN